MVKDYDQMKDVMLLRHNVLDMASVPMSHKENTKVQKIRHDGVPEDLFEMTTQ